VSESTEIPEIEIKSPALNKTFTTSKDPFDLTKDEIAKLDAIAPTARRRINRKIAGSKNIDGFETSAYNLLGTVMPPHNLDTLATLYEKSPVQKAAVDAKVANIVSLGYDLIPTHATRKKIADTEEGDPKTKLLNRIERVKGDVYEWLDTLNEDEDIVSVLRKVYIDLEATGNGYIEIGRKVNGEIGYVGHIPSPTMRIRQARDGFVQMVGTKVVFFKNFQSDDTNPVTSDSEPNEIIHLKVFTPTNSYYGVPDVVAATNSVAGNEFAERFNVSYFQNSATPKYVIVVKGGTLSATSESNLVKFFESNQGEFHRSLFIPLPADTGDRKTSFEMKPIESGVQDSSFDKYIDGNNKNILSVNHVPASLVGYAGNSGLAASISDKRSFIEQVVQPAQKHLEKWLNKIIAEKTDTFSLRLKQNSIVDEVNQAQIDGVYLMYGVTVPNEIRDRVGKPPLEGGNLTYQQTTEQAAEKAQEKQLQAENARARDKERAVNASDRGATGRAPQGAGRQQA